MIRLLLALLLALSLPAGAAETPRGLMWNRSGLPLVFPLQVKTRAGQDYYVVLSDAETGEDVLAAYFEGGTFFRVLVPPGRFDVTFHRGLAWHGEERLFGAGDATESFVFPEPLRFGVEGIARKSGHLIDLRDEAPGVLAMDRARDRGLCQRLAATLEPIQGEPGDPLVNAEPPQPFDGDLLDLDRVQDYRRDRARPDPIPYDPVPRYRRSFVLVETLCG